MAEKHYLPNGSVVSLKDSQKRVMIYGRRVKSRDQNKDFDYMACMYPEGFLSSGEAILFNQEDIQMIYFLGFQDLEEFHFRSLLQKAEEDSEAAV